MSTLAQEHDCLLLDLDGTVFRGHEPTPGAVDTLAVVRSRTLFVTNNASRGPAEVAEHLCAMGFTAKPDDIVTSAQSAARLLQEQLQPGAAVLIVGTDSLAAEVRKAGLQARPAVVRRSGRCRAGTFDRRPAGPTSPKRRWPSAAEHCGSPRTSTRRCRPNEDYCPETGRWSPRCAPPPTVNRWWPASPSRHLLTDALARGKFRAPLVVGDRLDTDIAGANAAGLPSLLVLCGVSTAAEAVRTATGPTPQLHRRRPPLAVRPRRQPSHRAAPGVARRRRPVGGDRAVDRQGPGRPAVGGPRHRQRGLERPPRRAAASS